MTMNTARMAGNAGMGNSRTVTLAETQLTSPYSKILELVV